MAAFLTALLIASLFAACAGDAEERRSPPRPGPLGACLKREIDNFVRRDDLFGARAEAWIPAGLRKSAREVRVYGPFDTTFGEEIDGRIVPPAETALLFFDDEVVVRYRSEPTERQREATGRCLGSG